MRYLKIFKKFNESNHFNNRDLEKLLEKQIFYDITRSGSVTFNMDDETKNNLTKTVYDFLKTNVDYNKFQMELMNLIPQNFDLDSDEEIVQDYDGKKFDYFKISRGTWNDYNDFDGESDFENSSHDDIYIDFEGLASEIINKFK